MRAPSILALLTLCAVFCGCEKAPAPVVAPAVPPPSQEAITAFMNAATQGDAQALRTALAAGMPANQIDQDKNPALIFASYEGHIEAMQVLIDAGADVNMHGIQGSTPLMMSCGPKPNGFPDAVRLLLEHGAQVNAIDSNENFTALMYASVEGLSQIASILIKAGANPSMVDIDGDSAADFARQGGFSVLADRLQALIDQK